MSSLGLAASGSLFGDAGNDRCGIGTKIFGSGQSICSQMSEESSNQSFSSTLSITSGTSGCSNSGIVQNATQEELLFANANFEELMIELAQGHGENLNGLAMIMGCAPDAAAQMGTYWQARLADLLPQDSMHPEALLQGLKTSLEQDSALSAKCGRKI